MGKGETIEPGGFHTEQGILGRSPVLSEPMREFPHALLIIGEFLMNEDFLVRENNVDHFLGHVYAEEFCVLFHKQKFRQSPI